MSDKVAKIHTLPDDAPWQGGLPPQGSPEHPAHIRALDRVMSIQRPAVIAHLRSLRLRHPDATTEQIVRMLERRYLLAVTTGGAAVGATAVVPGIGTGITLALSGAETAGFLEATTLFAQSLAEVHGIAIDDPDRARALVMTLMLGTEGVDLLRQLAGQALGKGAGRTAYWGELVTKSLPRAAMGQIADRLKTMFLHHFAARATGTFVGKALPFGVGAAVGGAGNHLLGRRVVAASRKAFGAPPAVFPADLEPREGAARLEHLAADTAKRIGGAVAGVAGTASRGVIAAGRGVGTVVGGAASVARKALPGGRRRRADTASPGDE
ncbi:hypothetical protein [Microbacterium sediminis]|uniref:Uncharacterized protein n=1 Tax=Microbacterium sediminis TaxID=904291 RepID=A0A1B9NFI7_9MICO|nr:hypothetical protein [Microbacterium sediminis]OCG75357.1 hypothetical protein A7J15_02945 [Microbacterium sediminis]QBR74384.1 hypothetical protein E3O41_08190 [Microbacterium sediminis]